MVRGARRASAVAGPGAAVLAATKPGNQLVAEPDQTTVKVVKITSLPVGTVAAGDGLVALEGNVQNVWVGVARVGARASLHMLAVARRAEGDGNFPDTGPGAVIGVGVAPDAIKLDIFPH